MVAGIGAQFRPGEKVSNSGIYDVLHDQGHHQQHQVTCVYSEPFPPCRYCGDEVRFRLAIPAIHVKSHEQFRK